MVRSLYWHPERQAGANLFRFPGVTKTLGPYPVHQGDLAHVARWTPSVLLRLTKVSMMPVMSEDEIKDELCLR